MYNESNRDLVAAVRRSGELDLPVVSMETYNMNEDVLVLIEQFCCLLGIAYFYVYGVLVDNGIF